MFASETFQASLPILSNILFYFQKYFVTIFILLMLYYVTPLFIRKNIRDKNGNPIPPGPLLRYPCLRKYPERSVHAWAQKYGPMYSVWMGSQLFVVINDPKVARDLLVVNGAIFSGRSKGYFIKNHTILHGRGITASQYNDTWRSHRKIINSILTPKAIQGYSHVLDYEARMMVLTFYNVTKQGLLSVSPHDITGQYALNNMLNIIFGTRKDSSKDPLVQRALHLGMEFMQLTGPWTNIVDFIKPLQWIPTSTRSRARKLHNNFAQVYGAMIMQVKARLDRGEDVPECLVKTLIENQEREKLDWEDICFIANAFTTGGVHSTSGIIQWFLAFMPSHPEIQARAHEELDRVIGRDRWPMAEDEMQLPYIRAIIKEVQRVHSPFWMATPHCADEDFVYNGMFIPKHTVMILNCYSLHHNEERYPDSWTFNPDRYVGDNLSCAESSKLSDPMERDHWAFGAGRRICPGMPVAERELWLAISRMLWSFTIHSVPGEPISLEEYEGLSGRTPMPFKVKLIPRHENVDSVLCAEQDALC